jgi:hypothetical protein
VLVVLSADMEGVSGIAHAREIAAACPEYWLTGKPRFEAEVRAACEGLLAGGATQVVVLDNHASGNPRNISAASLPEGARLETWDLFDVPEHDGMLQVGYHPRGGVEGFLSHTYVPGLRLRCGDELISESHGRAWAARTRLLGIVGNDSHRETLGSLSSTPFLVAQKSGRGFASPSAGLDEISSFAETCARNAADIPPVDLPRDVELAASLPNGAEVMETMTNGGWSRVGDVEYSLNISTWDDVRAPLDAAVFAAFTPLLHAWSNDLTSEELADAYDEGKRAWLGDFVRTWATSSEPEWFTAPAPLLGRF